LQKKNILLYHNAFFSLNTVASVDGMKITVITGNALKSDALAARRKNTNIAKVMGDSKAFQLATKVWTVMHLAAAPVQNTTATYMFSRNLFLAKFVAEINFSPEKTVPQ